MAHLVCANHRRRVMVLSSCKIVHRENGSECLSFTMDLGDKTMTPKEVRDGSLPK